MSKIVKCTVRVQPLHSKQNVTVRTTGSWRSFPVNGINLTIPGTTLIVPTDEGIYWSDILNQVLPYLSAQ